MAGPRPRVGGCYLVLRRPWLAMPCGIYGDSERHARRYLSRFMGMYFTGDGAKSDKDGYFRLLSRVDDVINVVGHCLGTIKVSTKRRVDLEVTKL